MSEALARAVCELTGWADSESLRARVDRFAAEVALELGLAKEHAEKWTVDRRFVRTLIERCSVSETYFWRHREQLTAACHAVRQAAPSGPVVAWSAGCSTGEEAWSLAFALHDAGVELHRVRVLGTDVNASALEQAKLGRYGEWSFRGVSSCARERHFTSENGVCHVASGYRELVQFAHHNLLLPPPLARAHLIACRNVLIYFHPDAARAVLARLTSVLAPGGVLLLGTAEQRLAAELPLKAVEVEGGLYFQAPVAHATAPAAATSSTSAVEPVPAPVVEPARQCDVEAAWAALRRGAFDEARTFALRATARQEAEGHVVLATIESGRGELGAAFEQLRRAIYLDPELIIAHVTQAALYTRAGKEKDAQRARTNALRRLRAVDPETVLRAATPVKARELREALEVS